MTEQGGASLGPLRWCPRCGTRLRTQLDEDCPRCGLPAEVFARVAQLHSAYLEAAWKLTAAHRAAVDALLRDNGRDR